MMKWISLMLALLLMVNGGFMALASDVESDTEEVVSLAVQDAPEELNGFDLGPDGLASDENGAYQLGDATQEEVQVYNEGEDALEPVEEAETEPPQAEKTGELELGLNGISAAADEDTGNEPLDEVGENPEEETIEEEPVVESIPATNLTAPRLAMNIGVGETLDLNVTAEPEGAQCEITYALSAPKYLSVSEDGRITGIKSGKCTVTCSAVGLPDLKINVKVYAAPSRIRLKAAKTTLAEGDTTRLTYTLSSKSASTVTFHADDSGVLAVDEAGVVTALKAGEGTVTAETFNGKTATVNITVKAAPDHLIAAPEFIRLVSGGTATFKAALPEGTMGTITYRVLDPSIVSYEAKKGRVKALTQGSTAIRATAQNGVYVDCPVEVLPLPTAIELAETQIDMLIGETYVPAVTFTPENAYDALTLSSKRSKVAKIADGAVVAVGAGSTVITVKTANKITRTFTVNVAPAPTAIQLDKRIAYIDVGEALQLNHTLIGGGQTLISFDSSDPAIVDVDPATGLVTGVSEGMAAVTVRTLNGLSASTLIYVGEDGEDVDTIEGGFEITFMDMDRNDGILMCCGGEYAYIDSGDLGHVAVKYLKERGITHLKYYIGTHGHRDHVGGACAIMAAVKVDLVVVPHDKVASQIKRFAGTDAEKAAVNQAHYFVMRPGDRIYLGGARIDCLAPIIIKDLDPSKTKENTNSLITKVTYGSNTFMLTGDATGVEITELEKANPGAFQAQVLKNPHHYGQLPYAVELCHPEIIVFSTGSHNLPSSGYVKTLQKKGIDVYITAPNRNGNVTIVSDGTQMQVTTQY